MKYLRRILLPAILLIALYYWRLQIVYFFAAGCEIKKDCYSCLPLTTVTREEFSQKKFWGIKKGMKFKEVNKIIGEPFYISTVNENDFKFIADYSEWRKNRYVDFYVMYYIYYTKDSLVFKIETTEGR
ncbi:MAG: hypothetical protein K1X55_16055 [Chitinophagales bacterium]|nr:hypothetical protein [Chitinophagales bacterium]